MDKNESLQALLAEVVRRLPYPTGGSYSVDNLKACRTAFEEIINSLSFCIACGHVTTESCGYCEHCQEEKNVMTPEKINEMLNGECQVEGIRYSNIGADYVQSIDNDQIALDGVCAYDAYQIDGVSVSREEMQSAVDRW